MMFWFLVMLFLHQILACPITVDGALLPLIITMMKGCYGCQYIMYQKSTQQYVEGEGNRDESGIPLSFY